MTDRLFHANITYEKNSASLRLAVRRGESPLSAVAAQTEADFIPAFLTYDEGAGAATPYGYITKTTIMTHLSAHRRLLKSKPRQ